jgi:hypothetical protein|tara:strand:- start:3078 stop:3404 length:327 start_codon:yes stop_codon:yes gene_type:complete
MKLHLCWTEKYEVIRRYPPVEISSQKFPELELELLDVYNSHTSEEQSTAIEKLQYKMRHTKTGGRGETIFEMVEPYSSDLYKESVVYPDNNDTGTFKMFKEDDDNGEH